MNKKSSLESQLVEKLWNTVVGSGVEGVSPTWGVRVDMSNRELQRKQEWLHIAELESDISALYKGEKCIRNGQLFELESNSDDWDVALIPVLEQDDSPVGEVAAPSIVSMLKLVKREEGLQMLSRMINVRKILLTAEIMPSELLGVEFSTRDVHKDWLARWREGAQNAHSTSLQKFWARILAREVIKPGRYSIRAINFLHNMSPQDCEMVGLVSRLNLGGFIYREPGDYFSPDLHLPMFELLQELGLLKDSLNDNTTLQTQSEKNFRKALRCGNKAVFLEGNENQKEIIIPTYTLTRLGNEILSLCDRMADTAYLWAAGRDLKKRGLKVSVGDWVASGDAAGFYAERLEL